MGKISSKHGIVLFSVQSPHRYGAKPDQKVRLNFPCYMEALSCDLENFSLSSSVHQSGW